MEERKLRHSGILLGILAISFLVIRLFLYRHLEDMEALQLMTLLSAALICFFNFTGKQRTALVSSAAYFPSYLLDIWIRRGTGDHLPLFLQKTPVLWLIFYIIAVGTAYFTEKVFHVKH